MDSFWSGVAYERLDKFRNRGYVVTIEQAFCRVEGDPIAELIFQVRAHFSIHGFSIHGLVETSFVIGQSYITALGSPFLKNMAPSTPSTPYSVLFER